MSGMAMSDPALTRAKWACPNDRQLALRAKLRTGWSVKTNSLNSYSKPQPLSDEEQQRILQVIKESEAMEQNEQVRIGRLVEKLEKMKGNSLGNGTSSCILCGESFGLLGPTSYLCRDCGKSFCAQCGIETQNTCKEQIFLCKLCSEAREIWKKSGAWFFKSMPKFVIPGDKPSDRPQKFVGSSNWDLPTSKKPIWARTRGLSTSEVETGESSEDDLIASARNRSGPNIKRASSSTSNVQITKQVPNGSAKQSTASSSDDIAMLDDRSIDSRQSSAKLDVSSANEDSSKNVLSFDGDIKPSQSQLFHQLQQQQQQQQARGSSPSTPQRTNKTLPAVEGSVGSEGPSWPENPPRANQKWSRQSMDPVEKAGSPSDTQQPASEKKRLSTASTSSNISRTKEDPSNSTIRSSKTSQVNPPALSAGRRESSQYVIHRKVQSHRRSSTSTDDSANNSDGGTDSCYDHQYRSRSSTVSAHRNSDVSFGRIQRQTASSPSIRASIGSQRSIDEQNTIQHAGGQMFDASPRLRRRINTAEAGFAQRATHGNSSPSSPSAASVTNASLMGVNYRQQHSCESNTSLGRVSSSSTASNHGTGTAAGPAAAAVATHRRRRSSSGSNSLIESEIADAGTSRPHQHGSLSRRVSMSSLDASDPIMANSSSLGSAAVNDSSSPLGASSSSAYSSQPHVHRSSMASGDNRLPFSGSAGGEVQPQPQQRRSGGGRSRPQAFMAGSLGSLDFSLQYDVQSHIIFVTVYRAKNLQPMDQSGYSDPFVRIQLLTAGTTAEVKISELRTKTVHRTLDPEFNETISYDGVMETDMAKKYLKLAVMDEGHQASNCLGEIKVPLLRLKPNFRQMFNMFLEPPTQLLNNPHGSEMPSMSSPSMSRRSSMPAADLSLAMYPLSMKPHSSALLSGSQYNLHNDHDQRNGAMSAMSHHHHSHHHHHQYHHQQDQQRRFSGDCGRILLSLKYSTHRQGLLVGIVRCAGLMAKDLNGFSDPFVKVLLRPDPQHRKFKTSIKWKTLNPEFNEEFVFEGKLKELPRKTLEISVWDKDMGRRDDYLGGLQIGISSKGEHLRHWFETIKNPDIRHDRWHFLSEEFIP